MPAPYFLHSERYMDTVSVAASAPDTDNEMEEAPVVATDSLIDKLEFALEQLTIAAEASAAVSQAAAGTELRARLSLAVMGAWEWRRKESEGRRSAKGRQVVYLVQSA
jgi:hypothetical protein